MTTAIGRPPSRKRLIGLRWLAGLFYPDRPAHELRAATRDFYRRFCHAIRATRTSTR